MKKVILALAAFSSIAAFAATARLGSTSFAAGDTSATIDARAVTGVKHVTLAVKGETLSLGDVRVVYRTGNGSGPYKSSLYHVNKVVQSGGSVALDLEDNGFPVRRIEIQGASSGFNRDAYITAYGSN
jgi:hypothetical protein